MGSVEVAGTLVSVEDVSTGEQAARTEEERRIKTTNDLYGVEIILALYVKRLNPEGKTSEGFSLG
jgi:hypothetical protein